MNITIREFWTAFHGMIFGAIYLLAFTGGFAGLWSLRKWVLTEEGLRERMRRLLDERHIRYPGRCGRDGHRCAVPAFA